MCESRVTQTPEFFLDSRGVESPPSEYRASRLKPIKNQTSSMYTDTMVSTVVTENELSMRSAVSQPESEFDQPPTTDPLSEPRARVNSPASIEMSSHEQPGYQRFEEVSYWSSSSSSAQSGHYYPNGPVINADTDEEMESEVGVDDDEPSDDMHWFGPVNADNDDEYLLYRIPLEAAVRRLTLDDDDAGARDVVTIETISSDESQPSESENTRSTRELPSADEISVEDFQVTLLTITDSRMEESFRGLTRDDVQLIIYWHLNNMHLASDEMFAQNQDNTLISDIINHEVLIRRSEYSIRQRYGAMLVIIEHLFGIRCPFMDDQRIRKRVFVGKIRRMKDFYDRYYGVVEGEESNDSTPEDIITCESEGESNDELEHDQSFVDDDEEEDDEDEQSDDEEDYGTESGFQQEII